MNAKWPAVCLVSALFCGALAQRKNIDRFFDEFTAEWVRGNPELATGTRYFSGKEQDQFERHLTPRTDAYDDARAALAKRGLSELAGFSKTRMSEDQRLSADLLEWQLQAELRFHEIRDYYFPLNQMGGANASLIEALTVRHPLATVRDAENYAVALGEVSLRLDEATASMEKLAAKNVIPPRFILHATVRQMQSFADPSPSANAFVSAFVQKMSSIPSLSAETRTALTAEAEKIVETKIYPAWKKSIGVLQGMTGRATDDAGLWRLPGGEQAYAEYLKRYTTTSYTADEIHRIGLREVAHWEREMDAVLKKLGRTEGSLKERIAVLKSDMGYSQTEEGRAAILKDTEAMMRDAEKRAVPLFSEMPKAPVIVRAFPRFREANAAASYNSPAPDGSRPGVFQIPLRPERMTKFGLRTLVYHETVPGHHFQIALQVENRSLPRFRQVRAFGGISAMSEGWGLYAEKIAAESGWYEGDLEGLLGYMDSQLFRSRRLVVDTGLHAKRWTRQQAIEYGIEASEVERYVVFQARLAPT